MKLKHILCMALGFSLLTACYSFKVDDDEGRANRLSEKKAAEGCTLLETDKEYRECILATAKKNSPKTYTTAENSNGEALAIIKGDKPCEQCGERWSAKHSTEILEEEETETIIVQTPKKTEIVQEAVVETEVISTPEPVPAPVVAAVPAPVVVEEVPVPEQQKDKTWWDQYQKDKKPEVAKKVVCPCPDPNDPCPQCVQK